VLEAARREGTGWVKVDRELIAKVDNALEGIAATLKKAERENSSLYFQACCSHACDPRSNQIIHFKTRLVISYQVNDALEGTASTLEKAGRENSGLCFQVSHVRHPTHRSTKQAMIKSSCLARG